MQWDIENLVMNVMSNIMYIKLGIAVEGDPKDPFLFATSQRCRGRRYSFPLITPLYS